MMADFFGRPTDIDDIGTIEIGKELEARALDQNKIPSSELQRMLQKVRNESLIPNVKKFRLWQ